MRPRLVAAAAGLGLLVLTALPTGGIGPGPGRGGSASAAPAAAGDDGLDRGWLAGLATGLALGVLGAAWSGAA